MGKGKDLKRSNFESAPSLVAGTFRLPFLKGHNFAYSFLTRYRFKNEFDVRTAATEAELINDILYNEMSARLKSKSNFSEEWYGLTWSYGLSEKFGLGVSTFGFQTSSGGALELQMQGLTDQKDVNMLNYIREQGFDAYGLLWKIGLAAAFENVNLGLTVTTPKIQTCISFLYIVLGGTAHICNMIIT